jgi:peptidoglycan hydrolase-like protein with peptidoglycan-binding domain
MLQSYLISESLLPPRSATGYFGTLTEKAVQAWQKKYGVVTGGTPETTGFGVVGKLTRIALAKCGASTATTFDPHSTTTGQLPPTGTGGWGTGGGPFKDDTAISASCILESGKIGDCALK